ncbi:MAG: ABC transporter permease [Pseudomonadota bacterium]
MADFIRWRTLASGLALIGLLILVFFLSRLTGDPTNLYLPIDASLEAREQFRAMHGFDDPLIVQFGTYLRDLAQFDFGMSIRKERPAIDVVLEAYPWTVRLAGITMTLVVVSAIVIGSIAAARPGGVFDRVASILSITGASAPDFWIAIVGILLFAVSFGLLPTSGVGSPWHWIMPVAVLFFRPFGLILQVVRNSMITALSSAYVKTARAKGVRERTIIFVHALRNAMLPILTVTGDQAVGLLNGAVVVETIFGFPGIGSLMIDAITQRDFALVQTAIMITALVIFLMNLLIDLAYAMLDPRIRHR